MMTPTLSARSAPLPRRGCFVGLATVDLLYALDGYPAANTKVFARSQEFCAGGPATNAAVAFAHLGGEATLATVIGTHPLGSLIRADLAACRVTALDLARDFAGPPPLASIITTPNNGERTVIAARPVVPTLADLPAELAALIEGCDVLLVDGHYLPAAVLAAQAAAARQIPVVLDGGSWKPGLETLLAHVEVAICSEKFHPPSVAPGDPTLQWLIGRGVRCVACTRGERPVRFLSQSTPNQMEEVAVPPIKPVDTLGAGDIFHGAFCYHFLGGRNFAASLAEAAAVASRSCETMGTRAWMKASGA